MESGSRRTTLWKTSPCILNSTFYILDSMKTFPLTREQTEALTKDFPTPFHLYDEAAIRDNARRLTQAFSILPGFREHFAVKAAPNPFLLKILAAEGFGADCSSLAELRLCEAAGLPGDRIIFTSNETPDDEFREARRLGAVINLDDITLIDALAAATGSLPDTLCFPTIPAPSRPATPSSAIPRKPSTASPATSSSTPLSAPATSAWRPSACTPWSSPTNSTSSTTSKPPACCLNWPSN